MGAKVSTFVEVISGLCFIVSALFLGNITGAVTGTSPSDNRLFGLAFLCLAVSSASLFAWIKWRGG